MLTKADDYPIHQTPEPIAYSGSSRNFYDRYFFNGYHKQEDIFFAAAMGVYPHVNILDGAFSLIVDGVQHNVLASRVLHMERMDTHVGPVRVNVLEPLHRLQVLIDDAENGIKADLTFISRAPVQEEPRFTRRVGSMLMMDYTRMTQNGNWDGWIELRGRRIDVDSTNWVGTRDRSWGIRPVGESDPQTNPYAPDPQFYWLWAPINWEDCVTLYHLNDDADGKAWNTNGVLVPLTGKGDAETMNRVRSEINFKSGTRHAENAKIIFERHGGGIAEIAITPRFHWYMKGVGYGHPEFKHGAYVGELKTGYDEYKLSEVDDAANLHIQAISDVQMTGDFGQKTGRGVLEQLIIGPHKPSGFKDIMDMAP